MAKFTMGSVLFGLMTLVALFGKTSNMAGAIVLVPTPTLDESAAGTKTEELVVFDINNYKRVLPPPNFPPSPPSCPICAANFNDIDGCAQACPVLANFSMVLFNPGAFIDVIRCACADTFKAVYPQCVDCFVQTNQTDQLGTDNPNAILSGIRNICGLGSAVFGNVSAQDGEVPSISPTPTPTPSSAATRALTSQVGFTPIFVTTFAMVVLGIAGLLY